MLVYIKNQGTDADLRTRNGTVINFPILWWWERMTEEAGTSIWLAWSLMTGFFAYFMVSCMELLMFMFYEMGYLGLALWYFRTIGYYGSVIAYAIPFILAIIQVGVEGMTAFPGTWALVFMCFYGAQWIMDGLIHIYYIEDFIAHVEAQEPTDCVCSIPQVDDLPSLATADVKSAWEDALTEREELCKKELEECNAKNGADEGEKADAEEAAESIPDDEEEDDDDFEL